MGKVIISIMTKLLEHAIATARKLPDDAQDSLAVAVLNLSQGDPEPLDDAARAAIRRGLDQARNGQFVPGEEIEALWTRHGL